jgi:hypothetical protein
LKRSVAIGEEETEEGVLGRGENVVMIKTFSDALTAISILQSEIGIKGKIIVDPQQEQQYLRLVIKDEKGTFSELLSTLVNAGIEVESIDIQ